MMPVVVKKRKESLWRRQKNLLRMPVFLGICPSRWLVVRRSILHLTQMRDKSH